MIVILENKIKSGRENNKIVNKFHSEIKKRNVINTNRNCLTPQIFKLDPKIDPSKLIKLDIFIKDKQNSQNKRYHSRTVRRVFPNQGIAIQTHKNTKNTQYNQSVPKKTPRKNINIPKE